MSSEDPIGSYNIRTTSTRAGQSLDDCLFAFEEQVNAAEERRRAQIWREQRSRTREQPHSRVGRSSLLMVGAIAVTCATSFTSTESFELPQPHITQIAEVGESTTPQEWVGTLVLRGLGVIDQNS